MGGEDESKEKNHRKKKSVSRSGWRVIRPADDNAVIRKRHKMGIANDLSYQTLGKRL